MADASFSPTLEWRCGMRSSAGKYLTAESFGYSLNADGRAAAVRKIAAAWLLICARRQARTCARSKYSRWSRQRDSRQWLSGRT